MQEHFTSYSPTKIIFGPGCRKSLALEAENYGQYPMLVIDPYFRTNPLGIEILELLQSKFANVEVFSKIEPNPTNTSIDEAVDIFRTKGCDLIVAVGGGSTIDTAKAISIVAPYGGCCWEYTRRKGFVEKQPEGEGIKVIAIPTTAGTGAEATRFSVVSNHEEKAKCTIYSDAIIPDMAMIDPELMVSMPKMLRVHTGLDAFGHAIESFISKKATPYSRMIAKEALYLIGHNFKNIIDNPNDLDSLGNVAWASTLAGIAISHTATALPHGLGQTLSGFTNSSHGASVSCCLPNVIRWTLPYAESDIAWVTRVFDEKYNNVSDSEAAAALPDILLSLYESVGFSAGFRAMGLKDDQVDEFIEQMLIARQGAINNHPKKATEEELKKLIAQCM